MSIVAAVADCNCQSKNAHVLVSSEGSGGVGSTRDGAPALIVPACDTTTTLLAALKRSDAATKNSLRVKIVGHQ